MKKMTREELLAAFEVLADMDVTSAAFRASERIRQHLVAVEAEVAQAREAGWREASDFVEQFSSLPKLANDMRALKSRPAREPDACPVHGAPTADGGCNCADAKAVDEYWRQRHARETSDRDERNGTERMDKESREMASEENGLLPRRKCTSKRCVTYEGHTIHALGCKLAESFESDPDEKVES